MSAFRMKGFAIAVIAVMVCSAFAITVADDDSSAADGATEYKFQVQMNDGTNSYFVQGSHSGESFAVALKATLDDKGLTYDIADPGWVNSITANGVTYASGTWGSEPYYGFAIYYLDGKEWKTTATYNESDTFAIVFDKYLFTEPTGDDASKYCNSGFGYWSLLPSAVSGYSFQIQLNNGSNSYFVEGECDSISFANALVGLLDSKGLTYSTSASGWVTSITVDGVTYASGTWGSEPYYGFAIYYLDGKEWKATATYNESDTFAIVFDKYLFTEPTGDDASKYCNSGFGYWTLLPESVSDDDDNSNILIYVGAAILAIIAIAVIVFAVKKSGCS